MPFLLMTLLMIIRVAGSAPETMGQDTAPSSGPTNAKTQEIPGDINPATSSQQGINSSLPMSQKQLQEEKRDAFKTGPYDKEGNYTYDIEEKDTSEPEE